MIHIHILCFTVTARVLNASDPVTYNMWRAGKGKGICAVYPHAGEWGGGVSLYETVSGSGRGFR